MRVFCYVIATDAGSAPNYDPPCFTLAICKPRIRLAAEPGDLVLAFNGTQLGTNPHGVRWAGVVSEKLSFTDYWEDIRFGSKKSDIARRPDNIYEPAGLAFRQVTNPVHGPASKARDLRGRFVLTFGDAWYFGNLAPVLPPQFGLRMDGGRRGHRVTNLNQPLCASLRNWLDGQTVVSKAPRQEPRLHSEGRAGRQSC